MEPSLALLRLVAVLFFIRIENQMKIHIHYSPIPKPKDCEYMTIEEFKNAVECGAYTHDDGIGYYATEMKMTDKVCMYGPYDDIWTHVVWFNK